MVSAIVRYYIIILLLLIHVHPCYAQYPEEKNFTLYSVEQGLSNEQVTGAVQDSYGYLWIATKKGLNRYDGNLFQHFYADSSSHTLPQDEISKLRWIDKEQLAVITNSGLHIVNTRNMKSRNLLVPPGDLKYVFKVNYVSDIASDKAGNVFILTRSGFYQFNKQDKLVFRYDAYKKEDAEITNFIFGNSMAPAGTGIFLLSTMLGICVYDTATRILDLAAKTKSDFYKQVAAEGQARFLQSDDSSFTLLTGITNELIHYDTRLKKRFSIPLPFRSFDKFDWRSRFSRLNDTLYAVSGKENGFYLIKYNPATGIFHFDPHLCFENYFCSSLLLDYNGVLWIGTNKGLFRQNKSSILIEKMTVPFSRISSAKKDLYITSMTVANNRIFVGAYGAGLLVFDQATMAPLKQIDLSSYWASSNIITTLLAVNNDTVLVGTTGPLIWVNTKSYVTGKVKLPGWKDTDWISSQFKDSKNNTYVCIADTGKFYFRSANKKDFILSEHSEKFFQIVTPSAITEDPDGNIWFAGHGLSRYNYQQGRFDMLLDSFPKIKVPRKEVSTVQIDKSGTIYFAVPGNGLIIYNLLQKKYRQLTRNDGLPDNTINALILLGDKLWIGTESGLSNYDIKTQTISSFGVNDGMPKDAFTSYSFYFDTTNQKLYSAFNNTIVRFDPNKLFKNTVPPLFFIESISISGQEILYHPDKSISLPYNQNNFVINLSAVNFSDPYLQNFAYRFVKNGNEPWNEIGSQHNIIFSNLAPSHYRLQVKVFNKNNTWPEQLKEISIVVNPPFWKTIWFFVLIGLAVCSIIYYLQRRHINHIKRKANIDKLLAQTEMKALHSQMNPHFIFNCLNSIREMILNNENEQASLYLSKFARLIRITLNHSSKPFVSLEDTVDYLQRYLEMEQIRKSNFVYTIDVDENLQSNEILLPPMLIQPFIENAIWHGASPGKEMILTIHFKRKLHELICIVEDDGIGIENSLKNKEPQLNYQSVGIANIKQRIRVLNEKYNLQSTIEIKDKSGLNLNGETGTIVTIHLPIKTNDS